MIPNKIELAALCSSNMKGEQYEQKGCKEDTQKDIRTDEDVLG